MRRDASLLKRNRTLQESNTSFQQRIASLQESNTAFQQRNASLQESNTAYQQQVSALLKDKAEQENHTAALELSNDAYAKSAVDREEAYSTLLIAHAQLEHKSGRQETLIKVGELWTLFTTSCFPRDGERSWEPSVANSNSSNLRRKRLPYRNPRISRTFWSSSSTNENSTRISRSS